MSIDFAKLKKSSSIEKLTKALESQNKSFKDDRYWEATVDKAGNGFATIRFLDAPQVDGDDAQPFVQLWNHGFKGPSGTWYIENSLTTLGQEDPVSNYNSGLWNTGIEANRKLATDQKRKLNYISNILVIKDPANPSTEGKVYLYKYGKKIFDKIKDKLGIADEKAADTIVDPDDLKFNPFNFWEGANFKLKIRKVDNYRNYDKSEFESPSPLSNDDAEIEKIWKSSYSLKAVLDLKNFKSFADLEKRLNLVLGKSGGNTTKPKTAETTTLEETSQVESTPSAPVTVGDSSDDGDDAFAEFAKLAKE